MSLYLFIILIIRKKLKIWNGEDNLLVNQQHKPTKKYLIYIYINI